MLLKRGETVRSLLVVAMLDGDNGGIKLASVVLSLEPTTSQEYPSSVRGALRRKPRQRVQAVVHLVAIDHLAVTSLILVRPAYQT